MSAAFRNRKEPADPNHVELQGYTRKSDDADSDSPNGPNGPNGQQLNPAFVHDKDSDHPSSVHNGGTPAAGTKDREVDASMDSVDSDDDEYPGKEGKSKGSGKEGSDDVTFDDDYPDETGLGLIYSHHEKVPFKNFSAEVRAAVDVRQFLNSTYLALHLSETNPDVIVDVLLKKMLADVSDQGGSVLEEAKTSIFTHDKMHQLNRTIQCTGQFEGDTIDYDQNWICTMCTVPAISEAKVGVAVLSTPVNLGRNCQECRFVVLILTPTKVKGTKNEFERARTFATIFSDLDFRNQLLDADTEEKFKDMVATHARGLSTRHSVARINVSVQDKSAKIKCGFMKGIMGDLRRRWPHYFADYKDGVRDKKSILKSLSCTFFLYFACILPCIAFGVLNEANTDGVLNVEKVLYSQTFGGLIFAVFGGTPQIVLLTTAPLAIYSKIIYNISKDFDINFPAMYACVGLWNAFFLILYSVLDLSVLMQFSTRSSEEIFALFISIAFSVDAFKNCAANFAKYYNAEVCDPGYNSTAALEALMSSSSLNVTGTVNSTVNGTVNATVPELPGCQREISVLYLLLLLGTAWVGVMLYNFTRTPYLTAGKRELLADYSLPIAVIAMAFVGAYLFSDVGMEKSFRDDVRQGSLFQLVDFSSLSVGAIFGAMGLGFCLSLLFFMDQNISAALVNAPQNKMKKGTAYHWDLLVIAVVNAVISIFAFPMVHAALPHSPLHVRALADVEERVVQGHITQTVVRVRETRVTAILSHVLIGVSILLMFVLAYIPTPVLYGLFLYVAITALYDNQMFERITLFFTEQAAYPPTHYIRHVPQRKMHLFTLLQLLQLAVLCVFGFVNFSYLKMFFPVLIFLLIPIRHKLIPKIVEPKYVAAIDHSH
ncbi:solute carrier family 4 member 11-like isoform X2 [Babylonia areolata]|uniref:solute carrier family 4 member 11-like isoform X2 n=1 Tax=Babylonia areolata TaxID=304850 RepID=UPI003FD6A1B6